MKKILLIIAPVILLFFTTLYFQAAAQYAPNTIEILKNNIKMGYDQAYTGNRILQEIENRLIPIRQKINTLNEQIVLLDEEYKLTQKKIQDVKKQIAIKKMEIEILERDIRNTEENIELNTRVLLDLGVLMYENQKRYTDFDSDSKNLNMVKLLLSSSIISDITKNNSYLETAGNIGTRILSETESLKTEMGYTQNLLTDKAEKLEKLEKRLELENKIIATQKEAKEALIAFTRGSEAAYENLLEQARNEQKQILEEVQGYQNKIKEIERILTHTTEDTPSKTSNAVFDWPVSPEGGITAYFKDKEYEEKFGIVHNAIDIRVTEGTEIKAPADGYVYRVHDGDKGYSYLILAHRNNTLTVYGHLLEFAVKEGDIIKRGALIGYSGGRPGTPGAGYLTTGPHLHFEIYENGRHIDPLSVLNLSELPESYIPKEYL